MTDAHGNVLNRYEYDAFGNFTVKEENVTNRFCFTGEQYDPAGNLYYLRARFYSPAIGRFLNEDTYYGDGLNLYAYCHNNPLTYVDPTGHWCEKKQQETVQKYKDKGYSDQDAETMANYERLREEQGVDAAEKYLQEQVRGSESGSNTINVRPNGVTYEGPLYRNVGTLPDGTPVNPLEISDFTNRQNYRYTQNGQNGLYFASSQHVMEGEMGAYGSNPYADNRTTYRYDNVTLNGMLDLTNSNTRAELGVNIVIFNLDGIEFGTYTTIHDRQ